MAATNPGGALPIREAGSHPALGVERYTFNGEPSALDCQGPTRWYPPPRNGVLPPRIQDDVVRVNRLRLALRTDPRTCAVRLAILIPDLEHHQLFARVEMQREPVPALLIRRE